MLNITQKKNCSGCCACVDACAAKAITLKTDLEGFWYPEVDRKKCTLCGACEKTCPNLNTESTPKAPLEDAEFYAAQYRNDEIRLDSTSGGAFSAFATKIFSEGGHVGGAIYNDDFSVQHILSNQQSDLAKLRSSKYLQSSCVGFYQAVKAKLDQGEKVLVCGCPCQIAAFRLFLGKEYEQLILCDFICRGINSPKVFQKYLDSLTRMHGSKVVYTKAKNKELGWRRLTFKASFEDGQSYYGDRETDNYTRGYLKAGCFCRPSCYECCFKESARVADITLGDFWGIEKVAPELDDDTGTSLIICNTTKGKSFFSSVKSGFDYRRVDCTSILAGNTHLLESLPASSVNRSQFYRDLDQLPYEKVAEKYFPPKNKTVFHSTLQNAKQLAKHLKRIANSMGPSPRAWWQFIWLNFLRKNTHSSLLKGNFIIPTSHCVFDIDREARIVLNGILKVGHSCVKGSKLETRIKMNHKSTLIVNDTFVMYSGADVQVFENGTLTLDGGSGAGCNIFCQIVCANEVTIGRSTLIGRNVIIRDYDAHHILQDGYKVSAPIKIGKHCWIGDGAMITKGVSIGNGSIVAARSFVLSNVPHRSLVGGMPTILLNDDIEWKE